MRKYSFKCSNFRCFFSLSECKLKVLWWSRLHPRCTRHNFLMHMTKLKTESPSFTRRSKLSLAKPSHCHTCSEPFWAHGQDWGRRGRKGFRHRARFGPDWRRESEVSTQAGAKGSGPGMLQVLYLAALEARNEQAGAAIYPITQLPQAGPANAKKYFYDWCSYE